VSQRFGWLERFESKGEKVTSIKKNEWRDPVSGIEFVFVPGGTFEMGDVFDDVGDVDEKPVHTVTVPDFCIGKYPVTQRQYYAVMGENPSNFKMGNEYPVENVSWHDTEEFIKKLNEKTGDKFGFRLPSEAEWEYAARSGGKKERYAGGDDIDKLAWYFHNSGWTTHPVGGKEPNRLGIYDMSGNVLEWVEDIWHGDYTGAPADGSAWVELHCSSFRVLRGGSLFSAARYCRAAFRDCNQPTSPGMETGFRLACSANQ
jgi:formylglycine-generating enzyme required for sulfatase activity